MSVRADAPIKWRGNPGWEPEGAYCRLYDAHAVDTIQGTVDRVEKIIPMKGMGYGIYFILRTEKGTVPVHLGPTNYVEKQPIQLHARVGGGFHLFLLEFVLDRLLRTQAGRLVHHLHAERHRAAAAAVEQQQLLLDADRSHCAVASGRVASPAPAAATRITERSIAGVSRPVKVFCWLTW